MRKTKKTAYYIDADVPILLPFAREDFAKKINS